MKISNVEFDLVVIWFILETFSRFCYNFDSEQVEVILIHFFGRIFGKLFSSIFFKVMMNFFIFQLKLLKVDNWKKIHGNFYSEYSELYFSYTIQKPNRNTECLIWCVFTVTFHRREVSVRFFRTANMCRKHGARLQWQDEVKSFLKVIKIPLATYCKSPKFPYVPPTSF